MVERMHNVEILTSSAAASKLGVSVSTIARMAQAGRLQPIAKAPGVRGAYLFNRSDVEALATQGGAK